MYKVLIFLSLIGFLGCKQDVDSTNANSKSNVVNVKNSNSTIDLGVFTNQNFNSKLLSLNINSKWEYDLQNVSNARQQQLTAEQVKLNELPLNEVSEVTLFHAVEKVSEEAAKKGTYIPASIVCLLVNASKSESPDLNQFIEKFRAEMVGRNKQSPIAKFSLSATKEEKYNDIDFKVIDTEITYPTLKGAEDIVMRSKMLFHKKGDLIIRYSLSYSKEEQLEEILKVIKVILYK